MSKGMYTKNITPDGTVFFFNATLNKSVWKPPADATVHEAPNLKPLQAEDEEKSKNLEAIGAFAESLGSADQQQQREHKTMGGDESVLPPGWIKVIDQSSGRPYYANQYLNITQWEPPVVQPPPANSQLLPPPHSADANMSASIATSATASSSDIQPSSETIVE